MSGTVRDPESRNRAACKSCSACCPTTFYRFVYTQVRIQVGGTGGFIVCVEDTQSDATRVVLRRLAPGGWYEFEVAKPKPKPKPKKPKPKPKPNPKPKPEPNPLP